MRLQALDASRMLVLLHLAWLRWRDLRMEVYPRVGVSNTEELIRRIVDVETFRVDVNALDKFVGVLYEVLSVKLNLEEEAKRFEELCKLGIEVVPFYSDWYPRELLRYKSSGDYIYPPLVLYVRGVRVNVNARPVISVVGTRRCTEWGRKTAYQVGRIIASKGFILATGLAEGIDSEAARGALEANGFVIGVRPWLEPLSLPSESKRVVKGFPGRVAVMAENPYRPERFTERLYYLRNRIIAGMAKLVVVVEARDELGSGSMHQIELALKRGKHVAIFKHPRKGTIYDRAYEKYVGREAISVDSLKTLEAMLEEFSS